jgi:glutaredoxin-dependent peroxiredoxin
MSLLGQKAPDFTLVNHKREKVSLASLTANGRVVVAFYPAAFTGVCTKELCTFRDSLAALNDLKATVVGVSVDAPFSNAAFAAQNGLEFSLLSDYDRAVTRAYGVALDNFAGMPGYTASQRAVFIVSTDGTVSYEWIAPNPGVEPDYAAITAALS